VDDQETSSRPHATVRGQRAENMLAGAFAEAGWKVRTEPLGSDSSRPDLIVSRRGVSYAIEVKAATEGRSDRLIPLWSQACLQALRAAGNRQAPLAVVAAPRIAPRVAKQVLKFAAEHAPEVAAGVIDFAGLRQFQGPQLEGLNADEVHVSPATRPVRSSRAELFSDLNQWMLKVLLAPELPEHLLAAPRDRYRNASQLAAAANVSVMTAFRLVHRLQQEGYLHESDACLTLVRREHLFRRWQASAAVDRVEEAPMRFLLRGDPKIELRRVLKEGRACLGLFAAAQALELGFVQGVPPHVYVDRLDSADRHRWRSLAPAQAGEVPDLILRRASAPQAVFRAAVRGDDVSVSDVLQVWLDVSSHPSRGQEQADLIRRLVLDPVIREAAAHG
jgi:hypothetical protein